jgi:unsaturated rhamnogalacturonyl hydrolase
MFIYALAKAINRGYIENSYRKFAVNGYEGLINSMVTVTDNQMLSLNNICSVAGLGGNPYRDGSFEYYMSEPIVSNDLKGVGPFIMAGIQMHLLMYNAVKN